MPERVTAQGEVSGSVTMNLLDERINAEELARHGSPEAELIHGQKIFSDDLSNSRQPFDYGVKAGQPARPKFKEEGRCRN
jgi:hypothetical protein